MTNAKRKGLALVAEIDEAELAVRLMSIAIGLTRSAENKQTPAEILAHAEATWPAACGAFPFRRMARAAIEYLGECVENGQRPI